MVPEKFRRNLRPVSGVVGVARVRQVRLDTKEHPLKLYALINAESGSTPGNSEDALRTELQAIGLVADIVPVGAGDLNAAVQAAIASGPDALIVWGGDGSVACALSASGPSGPPVLALPGGTMNLVHKRLHGEDMDWKRILASALSAPEPEPFSAGCVSDHLFFVAAMMGQVTALAESREAARHGQLLKAAQLAVSSDALTLDRRLRLESVHASGNQTFDAVAAAVVIGGGPAPRLDVAAVDPQSTFDWMAIAVDALANGWREADSIEIDETRTVLITDVDGEEFAATIDGETLTMPSGTIISLKRHAANVLRARPT